MKCHRYHGRQASLPDPQLPWRQYASLYLRVLLMQADHAFYRLSIRGKNHALHDFRVAVRQLHTWFSMPSFVGEPDAKLLKKLKGCLKHTNRARDTVVHNRWLKKHGYHYRFRHHGDIAPAGWPKLRRRIRSAIDALGAGHSDADSSFATYAAIIRRLWLHSFILRLAAVHGADDAAIHRCRILAKRLRYLLEPLARSDRRLEQQVLALKRFQDHAGQLHDLAQLRMRLPSLPGVDDVIGQETAALFESFELRYLQVAGRLPDDVAWL
ncbi:CHAD domain-containing protein [Mariprofundus erugo]|uniref:CHAD domain-containing protein n=1 Tax=Mariprofundus erugo TaxID=2528639 RepID=UPI0010FF51CC|nr:CHAD domain-containing protein [Mariprofundus erugo]TLS77290.1 CHAD domain-containing protein [Mariprofundus erugo]